MKTSFFFPEGSEGGGLETFYYLMKIKCIGTGRTNELETKKIY